MKKSNKKFKILDLITFLVLTSAIATGLLAWMLEISQTISLVSGLLINATKDQIEAMNIVTELTRNLGDTAATLSIVSLLLATASFIVNRKHGKSNQGTIYMWPSYPCWFSLLSHAGST